MHAWRVSTLREDEGKLQLFVCLQVAGANLLFFLYLSTAGFFGLSGRLLTYAPAHAASALVDYLRLLLTHTLPHADICYKIKKNFENRFAFVHSFSFIHSLLTFFLTTDTV